MRAYGMAKKKEGITLSPLTPNEHNFITSHTGNLWAKLLIRAKNEAAMNPKSARMAREWEMQLQRWRQSEDYPFTASKT